MSSSRRIVVIRPVSSLQSSVMEGIQTPEKACKSLHEAIQLNRPKDALQIITSGTDINTKDENDSSPLHMAIELGHNEIARMLIDFGADMNVQDAKGLAPIHTATKLGNTEIVRLLSEKGCDVNIIFEPLKKEVIHHEECAHEEEKDSEGQMHTDEEHSHGSTNDEEETPADSDKITNDVSVSIADSNETTDELMDLELKSGSPLHFAIVFNQQEIVQILLKAGASTRARNAYGSTPLHVAAKKGYTEIANILLEFGASMDCKNNSRLTALHLAAEHGNADTAALFLRKGFSVDTTDDQGQSALFLACANGKDEVVELLLKAGAKVNKKNDDGVTAIHEASMAGHGKVVAMLLAAGASLNKKNCEGKTPLQEAACGGDVSAVSVLLAKGADPNEFCEQYAEEDGGTSLHFAVSSNKPAVVEVLMKAGVDSNKQNKTGTALHVAAKKGFPEVVKALVESGANTECRESCGLTPLHIACAVGSDKVVEVLVELGADLNAVTDKYKKEEKSKRGPPTFEEISAELEPGSHDDEGAREARKMILKMLKLRFQGGDVPLEDSEDEWETEEEDDEDTEEAKKMIEMLKLRFQSGAIPMEDSEDEWETEEEEELPERDSCFGSTPLHFAASNGEPKCTLALLKAGAAVDSKSENGRTALHVAALRNEPEVAKLLLQYNADIECKDHKGLTPLDLAVRESNPGLVNLLLSKGADVNVLTAEALAISDDQEREGTRNRFSFFGMSGFNSFSYRYTRLVLRNYIFNMKHLGLDLKDELKRFELGAVNTEKLKNNGEVAKMKSTLIGKTKVNFYEFLQRSVQHLVRFLQIEGVVDFLESTNFEEEYPCFSTLISNHFHQAKYRMLLIEKINTNGKTFLSNFPYEVLQIILEYFGREDLVNLLACFPECQASA